MVSVAAAGDRPALDAAAAAAEEASVVVSLLALQTPDIDHTDPTTVCRVSLVTVVSNAPTYSTVAAAAGRLLAVGHHQF